MFDQKKYRIEHREKQREYMKVYMKKYYPKHKDEYNICSKKWIKDHPEKRRLIHKKYRNQLRDKIIELLGGKCSNLNCAVIGGMTDWRALQIDHVNGGGNIEKQKYQRSMYSYYKHILEQIKDGSKDYQLLCANCNWIKRYENKECPQLKISAGILKKE